MSFPAHAVACLLTGALVALGALPVTAPPPAAAAPAAATADPGGPADPDDVISRADRILDGGAADSPRRADATLALRDVFLARPTMGFIDTVRATLLLARPTDGAQDPGGDGYRGGSARRCRDRVCVHYARRGADAPSSGRWVRRTLRVLTSVWDYEVGTLGYRRPPSDGNRGGDGRFDVYLAEIGSRGLFGYCTPERRVQGERFAASGYCVLDDDFARNQFGRAPIASLRVTAAHEFFHAIQFGYDFREDPWLLESTATWVEERFADRVDDNRRYLRYGTVRRPGVPLDSFSNDSYAHYGTWAFWELLGRRHGSRLVREVWERADARGDAPDQFSVAALASALEDHAGLRRTLASYAVANLSPATSYPEGDTWPSARVVRETGLGAARRTAARTVRVDHLAAQHLAYTPERGTRGRLRVRVDGPARDAAARVVVQRRDGRTDVRVVRLRRHGEGAVTVPFGARAIARVVVTLVNASARYRCRRGTQLACGGEPRGDGRRFDVTARVDRLTSNR